MHLGALEKYIINCCNNITVGAMSWLIMSLTIIITNTVPIIR